MEPRFGLFANIGFFSASRRDKGQQGKQQRSTGSILTRWLRDLRHGSRAPTPLETTPEKIDYRPPTVSIVRSQSTYLTEGRGQRRKKGPDCRRYSFHDHGHHHHHHHKFRIRPDGSEVPRPRNHQFFVDVEKGMMMPSRSTPNLQQQSQRDQTNKLYAYYDPRDGGGGGGSPPPAPPVRDSQSLKSIKYGPGHEKFPSWPVPSAAETPQALRQPPSGGSHRSKSWTDHTNYPKEKVVAYTRPYMKRQHSSQTQQKLKTVMERCEKIPPETYESRYNDKMSDRLYLPHVDRDGKQLGDTDYMVPSPPERDTCKPQLTQADLEEYAKSYQDQQGFDDFIKYSRGYDEFRKSDDTSSVLLHIHQKQLSYAQSEGYHSYVSSTDSTSTPFLDRLRRDSEAVATRPSSWDEDDTGRREGRDSVVTTSSGSASSSETLKWHGSMSDVSSVASSSCTHLASNKQQLIAHSARVQTPQRHHSESVLYMGGESRDGWKDRESRNNNANKLKLFAVNTYTVQDTPPSPNNRIPTLSVADRVNELEKQQKYSYLDPEKKHKIPDPTLKAIQKKALLSFYERHQNSNKGNWRSEPQLAQQLQPVPQPPPRLKVQLPSRRASSASDYASNNASKRSSVASNGKITPKHQHSNSCGSLSTDLLGPVIVGPSISLDDWVPEKPPERPPKNPNLRTAFPDLFQERPPSPDLPPPSPPTVLEDEVFHNDEPLPPPPTELETWQHDFQERLKETTTSHQTASPQVESKNTYLDQTLGLPERGSVKYSSARELLGFPRRASQRYPSKVAVNGSVAVSQKVGNGERFKVEPMHAQPLVKDKQRSSIAESTSREAPPPLQPRQMRINQSMRARISENRPAGIALRMSPPKDDKLKDPRNLGYTMSQSKASYLASRRERERIVPDSDTGSYKRTLSPNGHDSFTEPRVTPKDNAWPTNRTNKETVLKNNNNTSILRRASMNDKPAKIEEKEEYKKSPQLVLPDVLPVNAKLIAPRYIARPTQLSLVPVVQDEGPSPKTTPPSSPKSPLSPVRTSYTPPGTPPDRPVRRISPLSSPGASSPSTEQHPKVVEGLQMIQRTEVVLRVNACTTDASSQTEKEEMPPTPLPTRKKLQEEIDCEKLSEDFVSQLPTSDRLKEILVQGPEHKKPTDYVSGLFRLEVTSRPRPLNSPFRSRTTTPSNSPPPSTNANVTISTTKASESTSVVPTLEPSSPLSATSPYFTTSEPKARFLTRYSHDMNHLNIVKDTKDLSQKKEELVSRLDRKLEVLRSEQLVVSEECRVNDELGENVETYVAKLARPHETAKFRLHVEEVGKITSLLLGLSGRLARAENALMTMPEDHPERRILENKRDKLLEQLEEAKKLKESIDRRSVNVSNILYKYLNSEEYSDYDHFINMKAKLIMDSKEISDKIKLGEEQLTALKETLIISSEA